jgi:ubiquinone/menaquinone biosynthesis C-methylase UbiE
MLTSAYKNFWEVSDMTQAWQKIVTDTKDTPEITEWVVAMILDGIPEGNSALEVGCGVGRLMRVISAHFKWVYGIDISESMISLSNDFLKDYPTCHTTQTDGYTIPIESNTIDFAYSFITFQHLPDINCVRNNIQEIYRVLKPGGLCRIHTHKGLPYKGAFGEGGMSGWYFEHEEDFLNEFTQCGFDATVKLTPHQGQLVNIWVTGKKKEENQS